MSIKGNAGECPRAGDVDAYATGALDALLRDGLEAHLVGCDECRRTLAARIRFVAAADIATHHDGIDDGDLDRLHAATVERARRLTSRRE